MYVPAFFTGALIARYGTTRIALTGTVLLLLCGIVALSGTSKPHFWLALALLGFGWNFMFVGGTTLLTTAHAPEERVRVQATHDFIVFGSVAMTALTSGAVQATRGWNVLNLTVVPPVLIAFIVVGWHWVARSRMAAVRPSAF